MTRQTQQQSHGDHLNIVEDTWVWGGGGGVGGGGWMGTDTSKDDKSARDRKNHAHV